MEKIERPSLTELLAREYPFSVVAEAEGGYTILFPDLPGCMSVVDSLAEAGPVAEEIKTLWIETAYERGMEIPPPSYPEEYSGKFNLRIPRSLHRRLAESAEREDVSLNQYVATLLAARDADARVERRLALMELQLENISRRLRYQLSGMPFARPQRQSPRLVQLEEQAETVAA